MISYGMLQDSGQRLYITATAEARLGAVIAIRRLGVGLSQANLAETLHAPAGDRLEDGGRHTG